MCGVGVLVMVLLVEAVEIEVVEEGGMSGVMRGVVVCAA